jgi:hypothetical protein
MAEPQRGSLGLGYVRLSANAAGSVGLVADGIALLDDFARRCGMELGDVFVDDEPGGRLAWGSLLEAVRTVRPVAVLLPDVGGLLLPSIEVEHLQARLRRVTSAPLVVARPVAVPAPPPAAVPEPSANLPLRRGSCSEAVTSRRPRSSRARWRLSWLAR